MGRFIALLTAVGLLPAAVILAALVWSIARPRRRLWPPHRSTALHKILLWALTMAIFASAVALGLLGWGTLALPGWLRWGLGLPLVVAGNAVVWSAIAALGLGATSGEAGGLRTRGLYRHSRNPQYAADVAILVGIGLLSASATALPVIGAGVVLFILAPFAEEPWLRETYGDAFEAYAAGTPRFL